MISFNGCIYNTVVKLLIYINPHLRIVEEIINIIPGQIHAFIQYRSAQKQKQNDFDFCNLSSYGDIAYNTRLVTDLFYNLVSILIVAVVEFKMQSNCKISVA